MGPKVKPIGGPPSAFQLATLRSRSRARVRVVAHILIKLKTWGLQLECGHQTTRPVAHKVHKPFPRLPAPKHVYCVECPPRREVPHA